MSDRRERDALATELAAADPEPYDGTFTADEYYMQYARNMLRARKEQTDD